MPTRLKANVSPFRPEEPRDLFSKLDYDAPVIAVAPFYIYTAGADVYTNNILVASWRDRIPQWRKSDLPANTRVYIRPTAAASYIPLNGTLTTQVGDSQENLFGQDGTAYFLPFDVMWLTGFPYLKEIPPGMFLSGSNRGYPIPGHGVLDSMALRSVTAPIGTSFTQTVATGANLVVMGASAITSASGENGIYYTGGIDVTGFTRKFYEVFIWIVQANPADVVGNTLDFLLVDKGIRFGPIPLSVFNPYYDGTNVILSLPFALGIRDPDPTIGRSWYLGVSASTYDAQMGTVTVEGRGTYYTTAENGSNFNRAFLQRASSTRQLTSGKQ